MKELNEITIKNFEDSTNKEILDFVELIWLNYSTLISRLNTLDKRIDSLESELRWHKQLLKKAN